MHNTVTTLLRRFAGAAGLAALCALPTMAQPTAISRSVVLFPLDKPATVDQSVADTVVEGIRSRLAANSNWDAVTFYLKSPLVQRAVQSNSLTQAQVTGPFTSDNATAVTKTLGADYALIGSVEDANADATGKGNVTVSLQLISAADGKTVGTAGVSGAASGASMASDALLRLAADNAADKAVTQLFPATSATGRGTVRPGTTSTSAAPAGLPTGSITSGKKKSNSMLLIGGLALIGIIIAAGSGGHGSSSSGGGGGGGGGGTPPPFPF